MKKGSGRRRRRYGDLRRRRRRQGGFTRKKSQGGGHENFYLIQTIKLLSGFLPKDQVRGGMKIRNVVMEEEEGKKNYIFLTFVVQDLVSRDNTLTFVT